MRESRIERALTEGVIALGGMCEKFSSPQRRFVPDRLITWPDAWINFVELKAKDGALSDGQERDHARRRALGHPVVVLWSLAGVELYLNVITLVIAKAHPGPSDRFYARASAVRYLGRHGDGEDVGCFISCALTATYRGGAWTYTRDRSATRSPRRVAGRGG